MHRATLLLAILLVIGLAPSIGVADWLDPGRSGALRFRVVEPGAVLGGRASPDAQWYAVGSRQTAAAGTADGELEAPSEGGIWRLGTRSDRPVEGPTLFVTTPLSMKSGGRIGDYRIGRWPAEDGASMYPAPPGMVKVTRGAQTTPLSARLTLAPFLTKDQGDVWPKYVVIDPELVDLLELLADAMVARGLPGSTLHVMSGFRTPQYNAQGVGAGGRARNSRHTHGDAADVWVDDDGDGVLDDLDGDGKSTYADAQVMLRVLEEDVLPAHADLAGGAGVYRANAAHGPFLHVDTRGHRARWGLIE